MLKQQLRLSGAISAICLAGLTTVHAQAQDQSPADTGEDTIVVTASPIAKEQDDLLIGASVVTREEIQRRMSNTIGEMLKAEPGVSSSFFGPGASRPIIRGQGGDRVQVLDNGIGSIDASSSSVDHAVAVEPAQAEQVEIIRGTGLLRYGSSGSGGVVNVIDGRIPFAVPENGLEASVRVGASSVDDGRDVAFATDFEAAKFGDTSVVMHFDAALREADDYDIPGFAESAAFRAMEEEDHEDDHDDDHDDDHADHDEHEEEEAFGTLENSSFETSAVSFGTSVINDRFTFGIAVKQTNSDYGIPAGHDHAHGEEGHDDDHEDDDHDDDHDDHDDHDDDHDHEHEHGGEGEGGVRINLEQLRYDLRGEYRLGTTAFETVRVALGISDYEHREIEPSGEVGTIFANQGWEGRVELVQRPQGGWRGASGVQMRQREFSAIGEEAFVPATETSQVGIFTFQDYETGPWHFEGAARYERTEHEDDMGTNLSFDGFSVSGGTGYQLTENVKIGGTVFRTERAPTTEELFSNGPHLATEAFEVGDASLGLETSTGAEAVLRGRYQRLNFTLNGFYTDYQDYIYQAETGEEEDGLPVFAYEATDATFSGFEAEADMLLGSAFGAEFIADGSVEYVLAEIGGGNGNLPRIPPLGVLAGLNADWDRVSIRGEVDYAAEQDEIAAFEMETDAYTLLNLYVTYRPFPQNEKLALRVSANNLSDEEARQHTSFLKDQVPLPGRNLRVSFEAGF
ncbi:TonB-dependent receptor [Aquisalinus flavus]|uniref:TonB-dependent receptor n=1 Tax=Aquisalinus flavus TaxID=1526572 RepID=A0A8J2Y614_9PROT|nr:TonB-dependent receptor [Aquisalinus flavus]MBD0427827.1 TonB-dependent receptor [Aquisalinus flavus]UNE47595.1 TonB-dependent receptor [Aquisalinus flavus]GGD04151.1 TonB-dependent receptor [Aquisalinus flavus]